MGRRDNKHNRVCLLLGSNMGNSLELMAAANRYIALQVGEIKQLSNIYQSSPWGNENQNDFYNQAILVETPFSPKMVLKKCLRIEKLLGRKREEKWGPRTIDIDILTYNYLRLNGAELQLPHSQLHLRRFTLQCMVELIPNYVHPVMKTSIKNLLLNCNDNGIVKKYDRITR